MKGVDIMNQTIFRKYEQPLKGGALLKPLIELRGHKCECCQNSEWLNQPINLQVHHIDGDKTNNCLDNLQLLCLNCHSQTDNFGTKNRKLKVHSDEEVLEALKNHKSIRAALFSLEMSDGNANYVRVRKLLEQNNNVEVGENLPQEQQKIQKEKHCPKCGKVISHTAKYCVECAQLAQRTVERPNRDELKNMIRTMSFLDIAKKYKVSDNAIRKWCDNYQLPRHARTIKAYTDEEWEEI